MQILQNVARRYGLVCLLHEKPFAGVNGSGKHNNWSMGTDEGENLLEPGDTPHENLQFLFFCTAVIQAVNKHQGLLRASIASPGQDHRLGANEAPPAIISIFLGSELEKAVRGDRARARPASPRPSRSSVSARRCCRRCRCTAATATAPARSRSPATSSSSARSGRACRCRSAEHGAEHDRRRGGRLPVRGARGRAATPAQSLEDALRPIIQSSYAANKPVVFGGDGYSEEWHAEAERRGLLNLPATPDALPYLVDRRHRHRVLQLRRAVSERELHSRYEVFARAVRRPSSTSSPRRPHRSRARCCCRRRSATRRSC